MNGIPFTGSYFYRVHVVFHLRRISANAETDLELLAKICRVLGAQ